jgi:hypothetical protein
MRRGWVALAALLAGLPAGAAAQELNGRVRETYQSVSGGGSEDESVLHNYEIHFKNRVTSEVLWQARLRALISDFDRPETAVAADDTVLLEPFAQVVYEGPSWQLSGGGRVTRLSAWHEAPEFETRRRRDLFGRLGWGGERRPRVDWLLQRIDLQENRLDTITDGRSLLTVTYGDGVGTTSFGLENRFFEDHRTDFTRDSIQATWNTDLRRTLAGGRVTVDGQALLVEGRIDEKAPQAILVDVVIPARAGLAAVDTTPLSGALASVPALIDGNLESPAFDLSGEFVNLGVDFGFPKTVDTLFVYLERRLLPGNDADYFWDVYRSDDGDFWTLATVSASTRFDDLTNRFEIRFAPLETRYVKAVNTRFSRDEPPIAVTEIEAVARENRIGRTERDQSRRSGNALVSWQVRPDLDVALSTFASRRADRGAGAAAAEEDVNTTLAATLRHDALTSALRLQAINRATTLGRPERDRIVTLSFAASPLPTLDLSLVGSHRANSSFGDLLVQADTVNLRVAARFLSATEAVLDLGYLRQEDGAIDRLLTRRGAQLAWVTTLRPGLVLTNTWIAERYAFGGAASFPDRTDLDLRSRIAYRPTRVLGAAFEYFYQDVAGLSGGSTLYDLDWLPFPGGALQLQFTVIRDRRSLTGSLRDETRLGARWTLNPRTRLDLAHARIRSGGPPAETQDQFTAFLEYRF